MLSMSVRNLWPVPRYNCSLLNASIPWITLSLPLNNAIITVFWTSAIYLTYLQIFFCSNLKKQQKIIQIKEWVKKEIFKRFCGFDPVNTHRYAPHEWKDEEGNCRKLGLQYTMRSNWSTILFTNSFTDSLTRSFTDWPTLSPTHLLILLLTHCIGIF